MSFAVPFIPYIMAGAAAVSGIAQYQNSQYQAAVATNNANLMAQTAQREQDAANLDMQDKDLAAKSQIAELMANMDASGLVSTTGSMMLRTKGARDLATRDRERLAQKRDVQFENRKREESAYRAEASAAKKAGRLGLLTSVLSIPTSFLSGASLVNEYTTGRLALTNPSVVG